MNYGNDIAARLDKALDRNRALTLLRGAVGAESITGNEANFVAFLEDEMRARNLAPEKEVFAANRPNIWGERKGLGDGPRLQFIGHTDTVHVDGWEEHWKGTERENPFGAVEVDGAIWGRGVTDLKGGIAASIAALDLLDSAGVKLKGDVAFAFVGDEESGEEGMGVSAGVAHWCNLVAGGRISKPDFAVYVEPTSLSVYTAQIGFFIADVTITGKSAYFGRPNLGVDALKAGHAVLERVWKYVERLEALDNHELTGQSSILVTGMSSGGYIAVPEECRFSVIASLRPGDSLDEVIAGFEEAVHGTDIAEGITIDISYPAGRDHLNGGTPAEIDRDLDGIAGLSAAMSSVGTQYGNIGGAPFWSESSFLIHRLGIPTVYCAPGDISCCHTSQEHLPTEEYLAAVKGYAQFMIEYCGLG